jgi:hypothetical protein
MENVYLVILGLAGGFVGVIAVFFTVCSVSLAVRAVISSMRDVKKMREEQ